MSAKARETGADLNGGQFRKLLAFLERLDRAGIPYTITHSREGAVMISAVSPGVYWEIEFLDDGDVDVERYWSKGEIEDEGVIEELFAAYSKDPAQGQQDGCT